VCTGMTIMVGVGVGPPKFLAAHNQHASLRPPPHDVDGCHASAFCGAQALHLQ
jgi:hypothetical protein